MARKRKTTESYIKAALRRIWGWDAERKRARTRALIQKKPAELFHCEECGLEPLPRDEVQIDHIVPVEDVRGFDGNWTAWIGRLFCPAEGLKIVCLACHYAKSAKENAERRANRRKAS